MKTALTVLATIGALVAAAWLYGATIAAQSPWEYEDIDYA